MRKQRFGFKGFEQEVTGPRAHGLDSSINLIKTNPSQAEQLVNAGIAAVKGKAPGTALVATSFKSITFTLDPIASTLKTDAEHAKALGFIDSTDLKNIYDLTLLNKMLTDQHKATITP